MTNYQSYRDSRDALATIDTLTKRCDCDDTLPRTSICIHFRAQTALRDLLIDIDAQPQLNSNPLITDDPALFDFIRALLTRILDEHALALMRLDNSLCPMHHIDYAICFDDDDPECATIRAYFPSHDT